MAPLFDKTLSLIFSGQPGSAHSYPQKQDALLKKLIREAFDLLPVSSDYQKSRRLSD